MHLDLILAGIAAILGGLVNAVAGGGTLITFPVLTALGVPPITANITNTVALCPGYLGGAYAQRKDIKGMEKLMFLLIPVSIAGGFAGGFILIHTGEKTFNFLIPYLLLLGSILLACQPIVKKLFNPNLNSRKKTKKHNAFWSILLVTPSAMYGGYFGAGLGVVLLAVMGMYINANLTKINALKQTVSLIVNVTAAFLFVFYANVYWDYAIVMAICAFVGGAIGGRIAGRLNPEIFRWVVVCIGLAIALIFFFK